MPPAKSSFADITVDSQNLLAAVNANATLLPNIDKTPLEGAMTEVATLSARQKTLTADRQKTTQDLKAAVARSRDLAMQLRAGVKGQLGLRTEKLVEFQVQPLRKRTRKAKTVPQPAQKPAS